MAFFGLFKSKEEQKQTLDQGLEKSKESVLSKIGRAIAGKSTVDDDVLDNLEEALVTSDVGVETTLRIIERVQARAARDKYLGTDELNRILVEETCALLQENEKGNVQSLNDENIPKPYVIMVVGVNGVWQNNHYRQTGMAIQTSRQKSLFRRSGHVPCCCH